MRTETEPRSKRKAGTVTFQPTSEVRAHLNRLDQLQHIRKSWVLNQSLILGLPKVLERIGAVRN